MIVSLNYALAKIMESVQIEDVHFFFKHLSSNK